MLLRTRVIAVARIAAAALLASTALSVGATAAGAASFGPNTTFGHGPHSFTGGNWGGYVSTGSFTSASASWVMPTAECTSSSDLFAPWVGLDGDGSSTVEQTGVAVDCSNGSPVYKPWIEMFPAPPEYFDKPASAGDQFSGTVTYKGGSNYSLTLTNATEGWTQTFARSLSAKNVTAEAIIESPSDAYPKISPISFTDVTFDGKTLAATKPVPLSADDRGTGTWQPSAIDTDGMSFSLTES